MKIFYKKDFQRVLEEKYELKKEFEKYKEDSGNTINKLQDECFKYLEEKSKLENKSLKLDVVNEKLKEELNNAKMEAAAVKDELTKEKNRNGGFKKSNIEYQKKIEELKKQVSELTKQVEDLKSDRYLIRKVPSGKRKNTIKTSIRNYSSESRAIKYVKEKL